MADSQDDTEILLKPEEYFFSRTDDRGIIRAGNDVFQRISGYDWDQLIGAPHKVVRHDDMPKGLFQILWTGIKKRLPVVAYVKNRCADGRYYWVLAFVTPVEDGYLSVRIKPQSEYFRLIQTEYADLREREKADGLSAEDSAEALRARLADLGFVSYPDFAAKIAGVELTLLDQALGKKPDVLIENLGQIHGALSDVRTLCQEVAASCEEVDLLPTNLEIQSARLGAAAAPIGIIARDCNDRTRDLLAQMLEFVDTTNKATRCVNAALVRAAVARVQSDMVDIFAEQDSDTSDHDHGDELRILSGRNKTNAEEMAMRLHDIRDCLSICTSAVERIDRDVSGLNVTRTMCTIESEQFARNSATIKGILALLEMFQTDVPKKLKEISRHFKAINRNLDRIETG